MTWISDVLQNPSQSTLVVLAAVIALAVALYPRTS
jgi:hypothetical protein